jgi:hypothetical protein
LSPQGLTPAASLTLKGGAGLRIRAGGTTVSAQSNYRRVESVFNFRRTSLSGVLAVLLALPAGAEGVAGSYLAARHAGYESDFAKAAEF